MRILNVQIEQIDPVNQSQLASVIKNFRFILNCTQKSLDKAVLEAAIVGLIPISNNMLVLQKTGMYTYWITKFGHVPNLEIQIIQLMKLDEGRQRELSAKVSQFTSENNDLEKLIVKIVTEFSSIKE